MRQNEPSGNDVSVPSGRSRLAHRWGWACGAVFVLAALIILGYVLRSPPDEPSGRDIQMAADSRRWADLEISLHRWLRANPDDGNAWAMLGGLLFDQGREQEALSALRRVKDVDQAWAHAQTLIGETAIKRRHAAEA